MTKINLKQGFLLQGFQILLLIVTVGCLFGRHRGIQLTIHGR